MGVLAIWRYPVKAALCELLERRVRLERSDAPADGRFGTTGAFHDLAPIHLITTGTLAHLRAVAPESDWDVRRFRPNLVLDDGPDREPFAEDALLGGRLQGRSGLERAAIDSAVTRLREQA